MARWNSCNILDALTGTTRLWHYAAKGGALALDREHTVKSGEPVPPHLHAKSWSHLWHKKLNVAWLPPENVFLKVVELPQANFEETVAMVELQLEKFSPLPVTQIVWTLHLLPRHARPAPADATAGTAEALQTVAVVIVERQVVEAFLGQLETQGYLADSLELPVLDQLEAVEAKEDGVWIYPSVITGQNAALVAWWLGGALRDLSLVTLPPAGTTGESLKSQFGRLAWAGELEGWLTGQPKWYLVADTVQAALWQGALRAELDEQLTVVPALPPVELAGRTARRAVAANLRSNLLPAEFAARYHVQFVDRLWLRAITAVGMLYMAYVAVYFAIVFCPFIGLESQAENAEALVVAQGGSYTNALQLKARYEVLQERQNLKYAALDCWQLIADKLPAGITLGRLSFSDGRKLSLSGSIPAADVNQIIDFNDALRKATIKGKPMFDANAGDPFSEHQTASQVAWNFGLILKNAEETHK